MDEYPERIQRARNWLGQRAEGIPVEVTRAGGYQYVAVVYKISRADRPNLWFCVEFAEARADMRIRRICVR